MGSNQKNDMNFFQEEGGGGLKKKLLRNMCYQNQYLKLIYTYTYIYIKGVEEKNHFTLLN